MALKYWKIKHKKRDYKYVKKLKIGYLEDKVSSLTSRNTVSSMNFLMSL